jgi:hypothetical protein
LGIEKPSDPEWYLKDNTLKEILELLDGRPLNNIPISNNDGKYKIADKPPFYTFDSQGTIALNWKETPESPAIQLTYVYPENREAFSSLPFIIGENDPIFVDPAHNYYVFKDGQPLYKFIVKEQEYKIERCKDKAVASNNLLASLPLFPESIMWTLDGASYLVQTTTPEGEWALKQEGDKILLEDLKHPGYFISNTELIFCREINLKQAFPQAVFLQNKAGNVIIKIENKEISIKNDRLNCANSWDLLTLVLKTNNPNLLSDILSYTEFSNEGSLSRDNLSLLQQHITSAAENPLLSPSAIRLACLERQYYFDQSLMSDPESIELFVGLWSQYAATKTIAPQTTLPSEIEKRYLDYLRNAFIQAEKALELQVKSESKKDNQKTEEGNFVLNTLQSMLVPTESETKLIKLRSMYHKQFGVASAPTWQHLHHGISPTQNTWKPIKQPLATIGKRMAMQKEPVEIDELAETDESEKTSLSRNESALLEAAQEYHQSNSDYLNKESTNIRWWQDSLADAPLTDKEELVSQNLLQLYHLIQTSSSQERREILNWLTFAKTEDTACSWLAKVAKAPRHYPSVEKIFAQLNAVAAIEQSHDNLSKSLSEYTAQLDKLAEELDEHQQLYNNESTEKKILSDGWRTLLKDRINEIEKEKTLIEGKIQATEKKIDELSIKLEKKHSKIFPHANKAIHTIKKVFGMLLPALKLKLAFLQENKPIRLAKSTLTREFAIYKTPIDRAHLTENSRLVHYDNVFNDNFKQIKDSLLQTKEKDAELAEPKAASQKSDAVANVEAKAKEYREYIAGKETYQLREGVNLEEIANSLKGTADSLQKDLKAMEASLIHKANYNADPAKQLKFDNRGRPVDWRRLQKLAAKGQVYDYDKHLADPSVAQELEKGFFIYLVMQTRFMQLKRIESALAAVQNASSDNAKTAAIADLALHLSQVREYDLNDPNERQLLFIESASPKGLFNKEQIEQARKQKDLVGEMKRLADMPTGFGKSDYAIPAINALLNPPKELDPKSVKKLKAVKGVQGKYIANGKSLNLIARSRRLVFNIWPSALVDINKETLSNKTAASINRTVGKLKLSRGEFSLDQIDHLVHMVERCQRKKIPISVRSSDVAALFLNYIEAMEALSVATRERDQSKVEYYTDCVQSFMRILAVLTDTSAATIDESRTVLSPLEKTVYTLGKSDSVPSYAAEFACDFFFMLMKVDGFTEIIEKNENLSSGEVERLAKQFLHNEIFIKDLSAYLGVDDTEALLAYLSGDNPNRPAPSKQPGAASSYDLKKLDLAKGYYCLLMKSTLSGAVGETFGLSKLYAKDCQYAIPFEKKDIPKENPGSGGPSCYQNIDEILVKTVRTYLYRGLTSDNISQYVDTVWKEYYQELQESSPEELVKKESYAILTKLLEQAGAPSPVAILASAKDSSAIKAHLLTPENVENQKKNPELIKAFIMNCVLPQVKMFPETIDMTPQDMLLMIKQSVSMSGTPQEQEAHSLETTTSKVQGLSGKMQELIVSKTTAIKEKPATDEQLVTDLVSGYAERNIRAVIDPNAQIKFDSNNAFAVALAKTFKTADVSPLYIVYFDQQAGALVRMSVKDPSIITPYNEEEHNLYKQDTFTIYDQARSEGLDVKQMDNAAGVVLAGPALQLNPAIQAWGRMRGLANQQTVEVWAARTEETKKMFTNSMDSKENMQRIEQFRAFMTDNQTEADKPINLAAIKQLMKSELKVPLLLKMINDSKHIERGIFRKPNVNKALKHYQQFRSEFVSTQNYDPNSSYGPIGLEVDTHESLETNLQTLKNKAAQYLDSKESKPIAARLSQYRTRWEKASLPEKDRGGSNIGTSQEVTQETQQETQQEKQQLVQQ